MELLQQPKSGVDGLNILVVEDNAGQRETLADILSGFGLVVYLAAEGKTALHLLEKHNINLVVTDAYMEGMEGMGFIKALKALDKCVPIIGVTAASSSLRSMMKLLGARKVLAKPVDYGILVREIIEALNEGLDNDQPRHGPPFSTDVSGSASGLGWRITVDDRCGRKGLFR